MLCKVCLLPNAEIIERYDAPETLFYLDPPYFGCEADYGKRTFDRADFARLASQLSLIKGGFILSLNARPEVAEIFQGFDIETVDLSYTLNGSAQKQVEEFIISAPGLLTRVAPDPQLFD